MKPFRLSKLLLTLVLSLATRGQDGDKACTKPLPHIMLYRNLLSTMLILTTTVRACSVFVVEIFYKTFSTQYVAQ